MHARLARTIYQRGFTLIELMYAMGYFVIGVGGLIYFQSVAASASARAGDISMATNLTASTIEMMRATGAGTVLVSVQPLTATYDRFGNLTSTPQFYTVNQGAANAGPTYFTVVATYSIASTAYYQVLVNTTWTLAGNPFPHTVSFQTFIPTQ